MTFHEVRFPDDIAYGASRGPAYSTSVVAMASGFEQRNANWAAARGKWDGSSGLKQQAQLDILIAFFRARKGKAYGFRFKDWTDYRATSQSIGTGDGTTKTFQLVKAYVSGEGSETRTITKPVLGSVVRTSAESNKHPVGHQYSNGLALLCACSGTRRGGYGGF